MSEEAEKKPEVVEEKKPDVSDDSSDEDDGPSGHNWDNDDVNVGKSWLEGDDKVEEEEAASAVPESEAPHKERGERGGRPRGAGKKGGYPHGKRDHASSTYMPQTRPYDGYFSGFPAEWKSEDVVKYLSENDVPNVKAGDIVEVVVDSYEREGKTNVRAFIEFRNRTALQDFLSFNGKKTPEGSPSETFRAQVRKMSPVERKKREEEVKRREKEKKAQAEKEKKEREEAERKKKEAEAAEAKRKADREKTLKGIERSKEMKRTGKGGKGKKRNAGDANNMFAGLDDADE